MNNRHPNRIQSTAAASRWLVLAWILIATVTATDTGAAALTQAQEDGYRVWLHSLEETIALRTGAGRSEDVPLFPTGILASIGRTISADTSYVSVARALETLESKPRLLQEPSARTPMHALGRARNYAQIAEYDSALVWFEKAARRDTSGAYADELGLETTVASVACGDSVTVVRHLLGILGGRDLDAHREELELSYRYLIAADDSTNLDLLVREMATVPAVLNGRLAYWQAFALASLDRWSESLATLESLVAGGGVSYGLTEAQRAWVVIAIPDLLVLVGELDAAAPLYRALAESAVPGAATWATCQAAAVDFLAGRFLAAGTAFEQLCESSGETPWSGYACAMAALSDEMERIRAEGEPYGTAAFYER